MITEPNYYLEGIVHTKDDYEDFSGPLDVILMLLSKNKIEIRDIQISELLDQYLAYLDEMQAMDLDIASEFVQMASHLTYIKTKMLLTEEKEPTELELLVAALENLKNKDAITAVRQIAPSLASMTEYGMYMHVRGPLPMDKKNIEYHHSPEDLLSAFAQILLRGNSEKKTEQELQSIQRAAPKPIVYSVKDKSEQLLSYFSLYRSASMKDLYQTCCSRSELIALFLSVLELCSDGRLLLERNDNNEYYLHCPDDIVER